MPPSESAPNELSIGCKIDEKYELLEILAKGGASVVFKARHLLLDQVVAIKIFSPELSSSQELAAKRFQNEASLLSSLSHPNIVKFQAYGTCGNMQYLVLEFLEGESLEALIRREGALKEERVIPLLIGICKGLSYIHEHAIVHRDLKPGNIMVVSDEDGEQPKIIDFGIFKNLQNNDQSLTKSGAIPGSRNYMSPEQCKGEELDIRSDIYSFGCLAYEVLAGVAPMEAETDLLIMSNHLNKKFSVLPAKHGLSLDLESLIIRCLEKKPEERFSNCTELLEAIEFARHKPLQNKKKKEQLSLALKLSGLAAILILAFAVLIYFRDLGTRKVLNEANAKTLHAYRQDTVPSVGDNFLDSYQEFEDYLYWHSDYTNPRINTSEHKKAGFSKHKGATEDLARAAIFDSMIRMRLGLSELHPQVAVIRETLETQTLRRDLSGAAEAIFGSSKRLPKSMLADETFENRISNLAVLNLCRLSNSQNEASKQAERNVLRKQSEHCLCLLANCPDGADSLSSLVNYKDKLNTGQKQKLINTLSLMAEFDRLSGNFAQAEAYSTAACNLSEKDPSALAYYTESLICLAKLQHTQGLFSSAIPLLKETSTRCKTCLEHDIPLASFFGLADYLLDLKAYPELISLSQTALESSKHYKQTALLYMKQAEAFRLSGKKEQALKILQDSLNSQLQECLKDPVWDEVQKLILEYMHEGAYQKEALVKINLHYLDEMEKNTTTKRYLAAVNNLAGTLYRLNLMQPKTEEKIDAFLSSIESQSQNLPFATVELRYKQGLEALSKAKYDQALGHFRRALKSAKLIGSSQTLCIEPAIYGRLMETAGKMRNRQMLEQIQKEALEVIGKDHSGQSAEKESIYSASLRFFARKLYADSLAITGDLEQAIKIHTRLLSKHKSVAITFLPAFKDCALSLAAEYKELAEQAQLKIAKLQNEVLEMRNIDRVQLQKKQLEIVKLEQEKDLARVRASDALRACLAKLKQYRPAHCKEIIELIDELILLNRKSSNKEALSSLCKELNEQKHRSALTNSLLTTDLKTGLEWIYGF